MEERQKLNQEKVKLEEDKEGLQNEGQQLADEAAFARELASRAVVELKNLADEVTKLSYQNAKLSNDLSTAQELAFATAAKLPPKVKHTASKQCQTDLEISSPSPLGKHFPGSDEPSLNGLLDEIDIWRPHSNKNPFFSDVGQELKASQEIQESLKVALMEKENKETELLKQVEESKRRETDLENDLAGMWVLVAQLRKEQEMATKVSHNAPKQDTRSNSGGEYFQNDSKGVKVKDIYEQPSAQLEDVQSQLRRELQRSQELETIILHLKVKSL